jgi:hypothetical protein
MKPVATVLALVFLAACASLRGSWVWRRADGSYDPRQLSEDIYACEEYTAAADDRDDFRAPGARAYGGWGNSVFEFCMNGRGWTLAREAASRPDAAASTTRRDGASGTGVTGWSSAPRR